MVDPDAATQQIVVGRPTLPIAHEPSAVPAIRGKPPAEISAADVHDLVSAAHRENQHVDYHRRLPEKSKAAVERVLQSVSSLANAAGGVIIFGVDAKEGVPTKVAPIKKFDRDRDLGRLEELIREHVDPALATPDCHVVEDTAGKFLVLEVPPSDAGPHAVAYDGRSQFWTRDSAGRHLMFPADLRAAFLASGTDPEEPGRFRADRVACALRGDLTFTKGVPGLFLHVLPIGRLRTSIDADAVGLDWRSHLKPGRLILGWSSRTNMDGWLGYAHYKGETSAYAQYFRHGGIEVFAHMSAYSEASGGKKVLNGRVIERDVIGWLDKGLTWLRAADRPPPYAVCLTLTGVEGLRLCNRGSGAGEPVQGEGFDRKHAFLPEVILDQVPERIAEPMRAPFDVLWQAAGWSSSPGYDSQGKWVPVQ